MQCVNLAAVPALLQTIEDEEDRVEAALASRIATARRRPFSRRGEMNTDLVSRRAIQRIAEGVASRHKMRFERGDTNDASPVCFSREALEALQTVYAAEAVAIMNGAVVHRNSRRTERQRNVDVTLNLSDLYWGAIASGTVTPTRREELLCCLWQCAEVDAGARDSDSEFNEGDENGLFTDV